MDGFTAGTVVLIILAILVIVILAKGIRIIQQSEVMIIERLGRYHKTLHSGINVIIPIIDQPRSILWRYAQEIPGAGVVVRHVSKDRIDLRETVYARQHRNRDQCPDLFPDHGSGAFGVRNIQPAAGNRKTDADFPA